MAKVKFLNKFYLFSGLSKQRSSLDSPADRMKKKKLNKNDDKDFEDKVV